MATVTKDFRVKHGLVVEGTNATVDGSDIITEDALTGGTQTNITVTYNPTTKVVDFVSENGVADSTTDDLEEGEDNLYFTDTRAVDAVETAATSTNTADKIVQRDETGSFAAQDVTVSTLKIGPSQFNNNLGAGSGGSLGISSTAGVNITSDGSEGLNLFAYDGDLKLWSYDSANIVLDALGTGDVYKGSAAAGNEIATVGNIEDHSDLTTGVHGVTGNVVGTSDTQTLTNKTVSDSLHFQDGINNYSAIYANGADLKIDGSDDIVLTTNNGDIILNPDGSIYSNSVLAENELITQGRLDSYLGDATIDGSGGNTVADRIATAVSDLVDGAPALLDTLNELAAAIGDDESFATTIATDIGTKVSKAGDTMTGALAMGTNKITGLGTPTDDYDAATKKYTDDTFVTLEDLPGQLDDYIPLTQKGEADGVATLDEDGQVPVTQLAHVTEAIDGLSTSDIEEGTNLYFTDVRAVDALEAVVPNFTAVEVNSVAKQVAATVSAPTSGDPVTAYAFAKATYRSAKFLVKVAYSTHTEISEVLLTLDTSDNIAITEFAIVSTNGSASGISAGINGSNVELLVTPTNASSTVTVVGTLLA